MMPPPTAPSPLFQFMQSISLSNDVCIDIVDDNAKVHPTTKSYSLYDPLQESSSSASSTRWDTSSPAQGERKGTRHSFPPLQNSLHAPERLPSLDCIDRFLVECPEREASPTSILPHRLPSIDALEEATRIMTSRRGVKKTTKWLLDDEDIMSSIVKMPQRLPSLSNVVGKKRAQLGGSNPMAMQNESWSPHRPNRKRASWSPPSGTVCL